MPPIEDFIADATRRMDKSIESTRQEFNSVRTGRASPALLDRVQVDYYGTPTPLKNLAKGPDAGEEVHRYPERSEGTSQSRGKCSAFSAA